MARSDSGKCDVCFAKASWSLDVGGGELLLCDVCHARREGYAHGVLEERRRCAVLCWEKCVDALRAREERERASRESSKGFTSIK